MARKRTARLTHLAATGRIRMVDVSVKPASLRTAVASTVVRARSGVLDALTEGRLQKGDALSAARIAGVMAAKRTAEWIPLCHPLPLEWVDIELRRRGQNTMHIIATVRTMARTGVEMEALTAVSAAALTLYDMAKSADKGIEIGPTRLEMKVGGKSGRYRRRPTKRQGNTRNDQEAR